MNSAVHLKELLLSLQGHRYGIPGVTLLGNCLAFLRSWKMIFGKCEKFLLGCESAKLLFSHPGAKHRIYKAGFLRQE